MVKIKKISIILVILVIIILSFGIFIQFKKHQASDDVMYYLTEIRGYDESEIKTLESKWAFGGLPNYYVEVTFQNEPNIVYLYLAHHLIGQIEYYDMNGETIPIKDLKNYDPTTIENEKTSSLIE